MPVKPTDIERLKALIAECYGHAMRDGLARPRWPYRPTGPDVAYIVQEFGRWPVRAEWRAAGQRPPLPPPQPKTRLRPRPEDPTYNPDAGEEDLDLLGYFGPWDGGDTLDLPAPHIARSAP